MSRWLNAVVLATAVVASGCSSGPELAQGVHRATPDARHRMSAGVAGDRSNPPPPQAWRDGSNVVVLFHLADRDPGTVRTEGLSEAVEGVRLLDLGGRTVRTPSASGRRGDLVIARFDDDAEHVPTEIRLLLERGDDLGPVRVAPRRPTTLSGEDLPEAVPLGSESVRSILAVAEGAAGTYEIAHDDHREVALPSDVLFDTDRADLSGRADAVVVEAVDALRRLPPGAEVVVAGNTDDVGDEAYNLDLSRRRAETVAAAIESARPAVPVAVRVEARGETRPLVPNRGGTGEAIEANRSLNRRVSLEFPSDAATDPGAEDVDGVVVLPDATPAAGGTRVPGSLASAAATVANELGTSTFRLDVTAAERLDGAMRVSFALQNLGGSNPNGDAWVHLFADAARSDGSLDMDDSLTPESASLRSVRVVDGRLLARPLFDDAGLVVGSREFSGPLPVSSVLRLAAWFPAPPAGATTVDVMVPTFGTIRDLPLS